MAITKSVTDDKIEIVGPYKVLQIRATVVVKEDGEVLSESYHRRVVPPGQDASSETDEIKNWIYDQKQDKVVKIWVANYSCARDSEFIVFVHNYQGLSFKFNIFGLGA